MNLPMCRSCGEYSLAMILSLGRMPLANALLTEEQLTKPEPTYPLDLAFCTRCALVQVTETVPPEQLFREYYYFSSFSDTMLAHARAFPSRELGFLSVGAAVEVIFGREVHLRIPAPSLDGPDGFAPPLSLLLACEKPRHYFDVGHCERPVPSSRDRRGRYCDSVKSHSGNFQYFPLIRFAASY